jgi:hypothetical protein
MGQTPDILDASRAQAPINAIMADSKHPYCRGDKLAVLAVGRYSRLLRSGSHDVTTRPAGRWLSRRRPAPRDSGVATITRREGYPRCAKEDTHPE